MRGRWTPGVSVKTIWTSGRSMTPRTRVLVVCGVAEVIATFVPRIWLRRVDLPTFGLPTSATKPERRAAGLAVLVDLAAGGVGSVHRLWSFSARSAPLVLPAGSGRSSRSIAIS